MSDTVTVAQIALVGNGLTIIGTICLGIWTNTRFKKNERIRRENSKQLFIHQLQFQTEFEIYKELWSAIVDAGRSLQRLRPIFDHRDPNKNEEEEDQERRDDARKHGQLAIDIMDKQKPFYDPDIYPDMDKLVDIISKELIFTRPHNKRNDNYYDEGVETMKNYKTLADSICEKIRRKLYVTDL